MAQLRTKKVIKRLSKDKSKTQSVRCPQPQVKVISNTRADTHLSLLASTITAWLHRPEFSPFALIIALLISLISSYIFFYMTEKRDNGILVTYTVSHASSGKLPVEHEVQGLKNIPSELHHIAKGLPTDSFNIDMTTPQNVLINIPKNADRNRSTVKLYCSVVEAGDTPYISEVILIGRLFAPNALLSTGGQNLLNARLIKRRLVVDADIYDGRGDIVAVLKDNKWQYNRNSTFGDPVIKHDALSFTNNQGDVAIAIRSFNDGSIQFNGSLYCPETGQRIILNNFSVDPSA